MLRKLFVFFIPVLILLAVACEKGSKNARLEVRLTDSPGYYDAVNIDIKEVRVHTSETAGENEGGWITLSGINAGVYDLLKLTNGLDTLLASAELPAGKILQIRLILGDRNTIVVKGNTISLKTPSAMQSGLKLKVNATLTEGITYSILLDFDAARSIVKAGNSGIYNLKPVIRALAQAVSGAIKGKISPLEASPAIYAVSGTDSVGTYANQNGDFLIKGLNAGTYKVVILPEAPYQEKTLNNVNVNTGNVTDVGTVQLSK